MMFFLYHSSTSPTGRVLGRALGGRWGTLRFLRGAIPDVLVRWGSQEGLDAPITINKREALANAADKLRSLELMQEAGVRTVPFSRTPDNLGNIFFGRSRHHTRGSDIRIYEGETSYAHHDFYTGYIRPRHEFRLHVVGGEVIRSQIKVPEAEGGRSEMSLIRNRANGWLLNGLNSYRPNQERLDAAVKAVEALGLDFGAVDLLVGANDDLSYVLEVNTAPRCDERSARAYVDALSDLLRTRASVELAPRYDALERLRDRAD